MNQANQSKKSLEIEFGYDHHVNETLTSTATTRVVYPGIEDTSSVHYSDGDFINHRSSVTLVVKNSAHNNHSISLLCWILVLVLLLSIIVSIVVVICVCVKAKKTRSKQEHRIASHINAFSPPLSTANPSRHQSIEMLPKYVPSPAQSYSKLYQWCQQRELQQQYKSLWAVNPNNNNEEQIVVTEVNENPNAYKTRSLPSKNKQRPVSSIEDQDLDELYSRVNFSKKLRNRMTNNEAKIIAFCRSRSQNLSQYSNNSGGSGGGNTGPKEEAFVVYDERTAL